MLLTSHQNETVVNHLKALHTKPQYTDYQNMTTKIRPPTESLTLTQTKHNYLEGRGCIFS